MSVPMAGRQETRPLMMAPEASSRGAVGGDKSDNVRIAAAVLGSTAAALFGGASGALAAAEESVMRSAGDRAMAELLVYAGKTLISWGIPSAAGLFLVLVATSRVSSSSRGGARSSGDDGEGRPAFLRMFQQKKGEVKPTEYLKITPLNEILDSYSFSMTKATGSEARATTDARRRAFQKKLGDRLGDIDANALETITEAETKWREKAAKAQTKVDSISKQLRAVAIEAGDKEASKGGMMPGFGGGKKQDLQKQLGLVVAARAAVDDEYLLAVSKVLSDNQRKAFATLISEQASPGWQDADDIISLSPKSGHSGKRVFVLRFNGDVQASQVKSLRQEVTAVIRNASKEKGDEVVLVLNTGGGTVTGYGLAAAQLMRIKEAGLKLNICVEQVAASGGYMMACCADTIYASPFAVLGSIGVISELPNVYERLLREGIEFQTVTAGKYKRTLTPFKKPTEEDFNKNKQDIEQVLVLFKDFVAQNRPKLNIEEVATGETWFGPDALQRGLIDELKTLDDVLLGMFEAGADIFSVAYTPPQPPIAQLLSSPSADGKGSPFLAGRLSGLIGTALLSALKQSANLPHTEYLDTADRIRAIDPNTTHTSVKAVLRDATDPWFP